MKYEIIVAGSGGQGVQLFGEILAEACAREGKSVSYTVSYGAEVTGGDSQSKLVVSDMENDYTEPLEPNFVVLFSSRLLNELSSYDFPEDARMLYDEAIPLAEIISKIKMKIDHYCFFPAAKIAATELEKPMVANIVMLGAFVKMTHIVAPETIIKVIEEKVKAKFVEINKKAFLKGLE